MNKRSRKYKKAQKLFNALRAGQGLEPTGKPGPLIRKKFIRPTRKVRRHSGRKYARVLGPQKILDHDGVFLDYFWDDWHDYRDGMRDRTQWKGYPRSFWDEEEVIIINKKLLKHLKIRKARRKKNS